MFKKLTVSLLTVLLSVMMFAGLASAEESTYVAPKQIVLQVGSPSMLVDGYASFIDDNNLDVIPIIRNGSTILPIAKIINEFGGEVKWDGKEKKVTINLGENSVQLWIDKKTAKINGKDITLAVPATTINGRTMVPIKFVSDHLGIDLTWHGSSQYISLVYAYGGEYTYWFANGANLDTTTYANKGIGVFSDEGVGFAFDYLTKYGSPVVVHKGLSAWHEDMEDAAYDYYTEIYKSSDAYIYAFTEETFGDNPYDILDGIVQSYDTSMSAIDIRELGALRGAKNAFSYVNLTKSLDGKGYYCNGELIIFTDYTYTRIIFNTVSEAKNIFDTYIGDILNTINGSIKFSSGAAG